MGARVIGDGAACVGTRWHHQLPPVLMHSVRVRVFAVGCAGRDWRNGKLNQSFLRRSWCWELAGKHLRSSHRNLGTVAVLAAHENRSVVTVSGNGSVVLGAPVLTAQKDVEQMLHTKGESAHKPEDALLEEHVGEREKLRRHRIGLANKGRVPWNKGRQHTPETIERIRQRTYQAMHSPKVMAKLKLNPRHSQSDETRMKIRDKLREKWDLKKKIRGYQDECLKDWKESVAEAARRGGLEEEELEWNSHSILKRKLREQARTAVRAEREANKERNRVKRAGKSEEHRLKIAAAIKAKWEDPEYQSKVRTGMSKQGKKVSVASQRAKKTPTGIPDKKTSNQIALDDSFIAAVMAVDKRTRRAKSEVQELDDQSMLVSEVEKPSKPIVSGIRKVNILKKMDVPVKVDEVKHEVQTEVQTETTLEVVSEDEPPTQKVPAFVDPNASEKLRKLKLLQANRSMMEQRRRESAQHARNLMAEAEKAALALEAAASKDEFAMASLTETRRLMAEAARLIQTAENCNSDLMSSNKTL